MEHAGTRYVAVGRLGRPHGVSGEIRLDPMGTMPGGLKRYPRLYELGDGGQPKVYEVESWRWNGGIILVKFAGVGGRDEAVCLANRHLYVPRSELPRLGKGEYFHADIPGLKVVDGEGRELGVAEDIKPWGEYDMLFVRTGPKVWMLPVIGQYVLDVLPDEGRIVVDVPEGLGP